MPLPFGRTGYLKIGTVIYPALNIQVQNPRTLMVPPTVGRDWQWLYGEGVRITRVSAQILIRDKAGESLSDAFLNLFFSRTAGDTTAVTLEWIDGVRKATLSGAKGEFISLAVGKGDLLIWNVTFVAPGSPTYATMTTFTAPDATAPLTFANISVSGVSQEVYALEFSLTNNHVLNAPITNTAGANVGLGGLSQDAGILQAGASFTFRALDPGSPIADGGSVTVTISGTAGKTRSFTLKYLVGQNPDDEAIALGPVFRTIRYVVLGTTADAPITLGGSGF
ncbi:MAG: hypothetical protein KatS3mg023_3897 [Armatimonadota bacterium]|nr:MAG: hypothetical protein KatS3mg023_3897 [Armatimonadota bacterium]